MEKAAIIRRHRVLALAIVVALLAFLAALATCLVQPSSKSGASVTQNIKALPYITWSKPTKADRAKQGVTLHQDGACDGLNLLVYQTFPTVFLVDMTGRVLHAWGKGKTEWHHAELLPAGDMLLIDELEGALVKMSWSSQVAWSQAVDVHHSVTEARSGDLYALTQTVRSIPSIRSPKGKRAFDNSLAVLSDSGVLKKEIPLSRLIFETDIHPQDLTELMLKNDVEQGPALDAFHANTIEIIRRDVLAGDRKVLAEGDVLICIRNLNLIVAVDLRREKIVWRWGMTQLDRPHHPTLLDNGNILIFDNGSLRKYSRILELDPRTKKIVWQYTADPPESFFSMASGSSQRLPNGNTLITDSLRGRVFEVTPSGETVWEYFSTVFNKQGKRKVIWRMTRLTSASQLQQFTSIYKGKGTCKR